MKKDDIQLFQPVVYLGKKYLVVAKGTKRVLINPIIEGEGRKQYIGYNRLKRTKRRKK